jgi:hypothetical protein
MLEYVPFILGFVTGTIFQHALSRASITATLVSGEYLEGWGCLPLDVAEAALGGAMAFVLAAGIDRRARGRRTQLGPRLP